MNNELKKYYKYRPIYHYLENGDSAPHGFTKSIFKDKCLWYASPSKFNDPYDCNLRLHVDGCTEKDWEDYFEYLIGLDPSAKANLSLAKKEKWWVTRPEFKQTIGVNQHEDHYYRSSVFCLSKKPDSIPMFSYYADDHRGICIEFEFSNLEIPCGIECEQLSAGGVPYGGKVVFNDVVYPKVFPDLNYLRIRESSDFLQVLLFSKHHEWDHEDEFRIFRRKIAPSAAKFNPKLVKRIIFGCKADLAEIELVKEWMLGWPSDVILSKARPASDRFHLEIVDFDQISASPAA